MAVVGGKGERGAEGAGGQAGAAGASRVRRVERVPQDLPAAAGVMSWSSMSYTRMVLEIHTNTNESYVDPSLPLTEE